MIPGITIPKKRTIAKPDKDGFVLPNLMTEQPNIKPVVRKKRTPVAVVLACVVGMYLGFIWSAKQLNVFFDYNRLEFAPIVEVHQPIEVVPRVTPTLEPTATPAPTPIPTAELMAQFVWFRESGYGKAPKGYHMRCREQGKWNEIGYKVTSGFCFDSKEQGLAILKDQLASRSTASSVADALCTYNLGWFYDDKGRRAAYTTCSYYDDFVRYSSIVKQNTGSGTQ